jgi:hypothetical protein
MKPLDPPNTIEGDPQATEMLRLWAAHGKLNVSINIGSYEASNMDEAEAWGTILSDCAHHISRALQQRYDVPIEASLRTIREAFMTETSNPSTAFSGE